MKKKELKRENDCMRIILYSQTATVKTLFIDLRVMKQERDTIAASLPGVIKQLEREMGLSDRLQEICKGLETKLEAKDVTNKSLLDHVNKLDQQVKQLQNRELELLAELNDRAAPTLTRNQ